MSRLVSILGILLTTLSSPVVLRAADLIPPSPPTALIATVATCGQVDLSWSASNDEVGGSGLKGYIITRIDPTGEPAHYSTEVVIGAGRTTFSDTNYVRSSATLTYTVAALDNAGNRSTASNAETVITPACPGPSYGEQVIGDAYLEPLGKALATYGSRTALIYTKQNWNLTPDTWLYVRDENTGQTSRFLLHTSPGYYQIESDYVLTSATELWALSYDTNGGNVLLSQYVLNGSPIPTSAMLVSTKPLGDSNSRPTGLIRLKSGALMVSWYRGGFMYHEPDGSLNTGFAYRSSTGNWTVKFPLNIPNPYGGNITLSQMSMAQHPVDGSIWAFVKRDSYTNINALHFTEATNNFVVDWINTGYITMAADGVNGPEGEFPFLAAVSDPTRNAILLAYQANQWRILFTDSLYGYMNSIFLKEATATIARINADSTKSFMSFPAYMERLVHFGFSVLSDGTLWLAYQPINHQTLTWNEVYASSYFNNSWSAPVRVGFNYNNQNISSSQETPGVLVYRADQAQVAFRTPDLKIHSYTLSGSAPPPPDNFPPTTSITSPADGATVSGVVTVTAEASDNVGVAEVDLLVDGVVKGAKLAAPYTFLWDASTSGMGNHTLQTIAYDAVRNTANSATVSTIVPDTIPPVVAITSPSIGAVVLRNTTLTITATATDNVGVSKVEFYVNDKLLGTATSSPYVWSWKVPGKNNVSYVIKAVAFDAAGRTASATSTVTAR